MIIKYNGEGSLVVPVKGKDVTVINGTEIDLDEKQANDLLARSFKGVKQWVPVDQRQPKKKRKEGDQS